MLAGSGRIKLGTHLTELRPLDAIRVAPDVPRAVEAGAEGLEFVAFGPHHSGDGDPAEDDWVR